jgi:hypothetical protein
MQRRFDQQPTNRYKGGARFFQHSVLGPNAPHKHHQGQAGCLPLTVCPASMRPRQGLTQNCWGAVVLILKPNEVLLGLVIVMRPGSTFFLSPGTARPMSPKIAKRAKLRASALFQAGGKRNQVRKTQPRHANLTAGSASQCPKGALLRKSDPEIPQRAKKYR